MPRRGRAAAPAAAMSKDAEADGAAEVAIFEVVAELAAAVVWLVEAAELAAVAPYSTLDVVGVVAVA